MAVHHLGRASTRTRRRTRRTVGRAGLAGAGLAIGALTGVVVGFLTAGSQLGLPVLLGLVGAVAGTGAGMLLAGRRARRAAVVAPDQPEPVPPEVAVLATLPEPDPAPPEPAWLEDPQDPERRRMWDGEGWTEHVWRPRRVTA